jgi:hypothetical protein
LLKVVLMARIVLLPLGPCILLLLRILGSMRWRLIPLLLLLVLLLGDMARYYVSAI